MLWSPCLKSPSLSEYFTLIPISRLWIRSRQTSERFFLKNGPIPASFLFIFVLFALQFQKYKTGNRWCAWGSNPQSQDVSHKRYHRAMAAAQEFQFLEIQSCVNLFGPSNSYLDGAWRRNSIQKLFKLWKLSLLKCCFKIVRGLCSANQLTF